MKRLLVLSGKGGTGKTTVSAALMNLSEAKAVADCDVDAPNLHLVINQDKQHDLNKEVTDFMGGDKALVEADKCIGCGACESHCRFDAMRVVDGYAKVNEFACEGCGVCGYVCPSNAVTLQKDIAGTRTLYTGALVFSTATLKMGRGNSGKLVTDVKLAMLKAAPECELAITDGSPGIGCPVIASVSGMDLVLVVAEPSQSGISDLKRLVKTVESFQAKLAVCVNKYDTSVESTKEIVAFCSGNGIPFVGKIPFDKEAIKAVNQGYSIAEIESPAGLAVRDIYQSVLTLL